jgi:hypothetical protein
MPRPTKVSESKLRSIYGKAVKGGYDASYESFLGDFGNVPEDFEEFTKAPPKEAGSNSYAKDNQSAVKKLKA